MMGKVWLAIIMFFGAITGAAAQERPADVLRDHLYSGRLAEGLVAMEALADDDAEAAFGVGALTLFSSIENLVQPLYAHGFDPERGIAVSPFFGMMGTEGEERTPEPLTYEGLRSYLEAFSDDLDTAIPLLLTAAEGDFSVEIDVTRIRIDIDGDGEVGEAESVGAFLAMAAGAGQRLDMGSGMAPELGLPATSFAFDGSDAIWLAGYSQVLATQSDFLLAHDFENFFNAALHRLFPGAGLPMETYPNAGQLFMDSDSDALLADAIAMIHTINWPIIDRDRLIGARDRLFSVLDLSRRNWNSILAETDDHLEFIPSPYQTPLAPEMAVTKEMVEAWRETLDVSEAILRGELLLPHWRYGGLGFDLAAWFENAERTDAVLLFTGLDALPYLKEGDVADAESFAAANGVFGGSIWNYAAWFN
ncbi:hypothetical protein [Pelagibacterium halotolerans]|uniref:Uncharacterized protein n=1 Tax=Pelagibacterium halotolerans (strain DSM 22347 / JCM 15775 / CGMCC 1.7692 / B2) TaxID=1082931 RepID=G4RFF6_PELHB|nr:hypothetical protein [Pelagibacterium halotolerans]AEQ51994.1 hypothetical protein KKY_1984 [Pelagibacterium halotolerans B2]QJR18220.1 hypothetical protein HKM20_07100 [Pelagibacterium halotolerans]SDZ81159.1 hypothetical protein SAMN05428936_10156 [Pelagibacterium halotolerans]